MKNRPVLWCLTALLLLTALPAVATTLVIEGDLDIISSTPRVSVLVAGLAAQDPLWLDSTAVGALPPEAEVDGLLSLSGWEGAETSPEVAGRDLPDLSVWLAELEFPIELSLGAFFLLAGGGIAAFRARGRSRSTKGREPHDGSNLFPSKMNLQGGEEEI